MTGRQEMEREVPSTLDEFSLKRKQMCRVVSRMDATSRESIVVFPNKGF